MYLIITCKILIYIMAHQTTELLYREHHSWLYQWLRQRLASEYEAEDLAHDTFTRILTRRQESIHNPRAYLTTIAKGILVNWYQRQSLEKAYLDALSQLPEPEIPSEDHRYIILESLHKIDIMLDTLPDRAKQVFLLAQIEGLKYETIAHRLEVSLITVKRDMKKALTQCLLMM